MATARGKTKRATFFWAGGERSSCPSNIDIGTEVAIRGTLRDSGLPGVLLMTRKSTGWEQRGRGTTSHLSREYVSGERLGMILEQWIPLDFKGAEATVLDHPEQKAAIWSS